MMRSGPFWSALVLLALGGCRADPDTFSWKVDRPVPTGESSLGSEAIDDSGTSVDSGVE